MVFFPKIIYANARHSNVTELFWTLIITGISSEINNIEQNCQKRRLYSKQIIKEIAQF